MSQICFVRVTPYDKAHGALAKTVTVGGQKFIGKEPNSPVSKWYELPADVGRRLLPLRQETGVPFFEIIFDRDQWAQVTRYELASQLAGPEAAAVASLIAATAPKTVPAPRAPGSTSESSFGKIEATEAPVQDAMIGIITPQPAPEESFQDEAETPPVEDDLDGLSRAQLLREAKDRGIHVSTQLNRSEIIDRIRSEKKSE